MYTAVAAVVLHYIDERHACEYKKRDRVALNSFRPGRRSEREAGRPPIVRTANWILKS